MAQEIQRVTGGDIFEIVPVNAYPSSYTPCTEVALEERDNDARPPIKDKVAGWEDYDIVFIGCPVWWHTAPMIISTFAETYDFRGKTVVPFCTYASTYRDETLQKIADLTPAADHLTGFGSTGSVSGVQGWIEQIDAEWEEQHPTRKKIPPCRRRERNGSGTGAERVHSGIRGVYTIDGRSVGSLENAQGILNVSDGQETRKIMR